MIAISSNRTEQLEVGTTAPQVPRPASHWLHVVTHLDPKYGGLSAVVPQLCSSVNAARSTSVELAAFCLPSEFYKPAGYELAISYWPTGRGDWLRHKHLSRGFRDLVSGADGLHIHGLWEQSTNIAARTARSMGKPYVISAHGMLDSWALANKRWKKNIYAAIFEHTNVNRASCLHALTQAEAENYRAFGSKSPIVVIPNAVNLPHALDNEQFLARFPGLRGKQIVLFLGRLHFKKGLDILAKSWAAVAKDWPDARLVLAGPDSEGTQGSVEELIRSYALADKVLLTGMLDSPMKWSALAAAQCFVLPSYSEGLSTSVLEAMGAGLPVIVSRQCNTPEVREYETGWEIECNAEQLTRALREFLSGSVEQNEKIGARGKRLVQQRYNWASTATQMGEVYRWLSGGPVPQSVEVMK